MAAGGFDTVIGNPPWGAELTEPELAYHRQNSQAIIVRMIDSFMYFVYQSCNRLRTNGFFGMILPDVVLYQQDNRKLREFILKNFKIDMMLNMGDVFDQVTRPACILILERSIGPHDMITVADFSEISKANKPDAILESARFSSIHENDILSIPGMLFITSNPARYGIWTKVNSVPHKLLGELVDDDGIQRGVSPDLKQAFLVDSKTAQKFRLEKSRLRRVLTGGKQVKRYFIDYPDLWLIYTSNSNNFRELPNIRAYIDQFKAEITCSEVKQHKHSLYALHRARQEHIFLKKQKAVGVITEDEIIVALDDTQIFATDGLYVFGAHESVNVHYLLAILNSKLFIFIYRLLALEKGRVLAQVKPTTLAQLPIRSINFSDEANTARHDKMVQLVESMLTLRKHKAVAQTQAEQEQIQRQIEAADRRIDELVYGLYGLTPDEIAVVTGQK